MKLDYNRKFFLELLKVGLWGCGNLDIRIDGTTDWHEVYRLATEQSVLGLVLAGIERVKNLNHNINIPQVLLLQMIGEVQVIEQRNKAMNGFVAELIEKLRNEDVYAILVKGQGIAQCYERPLWRTSGDVDLLLSDSNYEKAKKTLLPLATDVESEYKALKHLGMTMQGGFVVELHGTMHSRLSKRVDRSIDEVQKDVFFNGNVRSWANGNTKVFLPSADNDVVFVFTHILHHYFIDGIGLRQICDWCRLLYTYRESLNHGLLESRLRKAGLMSEWRAFYNLAHRYLGMPDFGSGLMVYDSWFDKKADRIMEFVMKVGNFGHNQERAHSDSYVLRKVFSLWRKFKNFYHHFKVFPVDSIKFFCGFVISGLDAASRRE